MPTSTLPWLACLSVPTSPELLLRQQPGTPAACAPMLMRADVVLRTGSGCFICMRTSVPAGRPVGFSLLFCPLFRMSWCVSSLCLSQHMHVSPRAAADTAAGKVVYERWDAESFLSRILI